MSISSNITFKLIDNSTNKLIEVPYSDVMKKLYKGKVSLPKNLSNKELQELKINLSKIDNYIPLYDIFSDNLYIFKKKYVYDNVFKKYFRFPTIKFINQIKNKLAEQEKIYKTKKDKKDMKTIILKDQIKRYHLMLDFLNCFDPQTLLDTYIVVLYNINELGSKLTLCRKPSFTPLLSDIIPYYTQDEIVKMALNMNIIKSETHITNEDRRLLCEKISQNDINSKNLIAHHKYIIENKMIGLIQYYSINGFMTLNHYLRYSKVANEHLDKIIKTLSDIILNAPKLDKNYYLYRFIADDSFINTLNIGDIFTEKGFLSTTRNPFYSQDNLVFGWNLIKLKVNNKIPMLCIESISNFHSEEEIIFAPNTTMKLISKNDKNIYYHPDKRIQDSVQNIYEFEIINTNKYIPDKIQIKENILFNQPFLQINENNNINEIDFLKLDNEKIKNYTSMKEKINDFLNTYTNNFNQFYTKLGNKRLLITVESYDSSSVYRNYYKLRTSAGIMFYCIDNNHQIFIIEFSDDKIVVNYGSKFNTYIYSNIYNEKDFLLLISKIAHYFNIFMINLYCNYYNCDYFSDNITETSDSQLKYIHYNGIICVDMYNYITKHIKRFNDIPNNVIKPKFEYNLLDKFDKITIDKHFFKKKSIILHALFRKIYIRYHNKSDKITIKDFYLWLCDYYCYYVKEFIKLINELPEFKECNILNNDYYLFYPMNYLYNNSFINTMPNITRNIRVQTMKNMLFTRDSDPRIQTYTKEMYF